MDSSKQQLRKTLQTARLALSPEERREQSKDIAERLLQEINWPDYPKVHCFEPIMRLGEVDLVDFVTALQAGREKIEVYTSRKFKGEWLVVSADTDQLADPVPAFDVIIVPMLGFDASLQRIGWGGGYYDKFLAAQPQAIKIGVCYSIGEVEHIPAEPHDVPLDMIVTERHTHKSTKGA